MLKVTEVEIMNLKAAIRGMRNPLESHSMSDSCICCDKIEHTCAGCIECDPRKTFILGHNDIDLAGRLIKSGNDHRKFMRQILVSMDIQAPLYWWKQFDQYKVGTVSNSYSTMHTLHRTDLSIDDFSTDNMTTLGKMCLSSSIKYMNNALKEYRDTKNKQMWNDVIALLPSSYNQKRTITMNYEVLYNIYNSRKNHKLTEWHELCDVIKNMPYAEQFIAM